MKVETTLCSSWVNHFPFFVILSTASSGLNSLAAITFEDIVKFRLPAEYQDKSVKYTKYIGKSTNL